MRALTRLVLASSCALALAVAAAAAQEIDPRLGRLAPETRAPVAALIDSARTARLPVEPLIQRSLEGTLKGAPNELIVAAVRRLAADLAGARSALNPAASSAELVAGAAALRAGASPQVLQELRRRRRGSLTVALAVLTDLVASRVPVDSAAAAVLALAPGTPDADLVEFRRAVERDVALGASPGAAVSTAALVSGGAQSTGLNTSGRQARPTKP